MIVTERFNTIVAEWMRAPAITIPDTMVLPEARRLMRERNIRRLPVVDAAGALVGIVTEGDIIRISDSHEFDVRDYNLMHRVADLPVREIMTRDVATVAPTTSIVEVARLLLRKRIGGVPVCDGQQIVGVITESDLFRLIIEAVEDD